MEEDKSAACVVYFGEFALDLRRHGLYRGFQRVHLTPKPVETLIYLVQNQRRVVQKKELLDSVWQDVFVTEDTLVHAIREIRHALQDDRENPHFILTVPRQGYRFIAEVSTEPPADSSPGVASSPPVREATRRLPNWAWVPSLIVAIAALVLITASHRARNAVPAPAAYEREWTQLTTEPLGAGKPAYSPDGNILYIANGAIHIRPASDDRHLQITGAICPSGDMPVFTADGSHVVFALPRSGAAGSRSLDLWIVRSTGGHVRRFLQDAAGAGFSPDGRWVAYTKYLPMRKALWASPVDHLEEHLEIAQTGFVPRWSPDGRWLAYATGDPNESEGVLCVASVSYRGARLTVSPARQITAQPQPMYGMAWAPDSASLIFAARRQGPTHLYRLRVSEGTVTPVTSGADTEICPSVSPDGKTLICWHGSPANNLSVFDGLTSAKPKLATEDETHFWIRLSPSGTRLASVVERPDTHQRLYVTELATGKRTRVSERPARHPCWIDENNVAHAEDDPTGRTAIHVANVVTRVDSTVTSFPGRASWPAFHPRYSNLLAAVLDSPAGGDRIVLRDLDRPNSDRVLATGAKYEALRWSPDGSRLAWSGPEPSSGSSHNGIWVFDLNRWVAQRLLPDGYGPAWSADGSVLFFWRIREYSGLWQFDRRTKKQSQVRRWREWSRHDFDIVGGRLAVASEGGRGQVYAMPLED